MNCPRYFTTANKAFLVGILTLICVSNAHSKEVLKSKSKPLTSLCAKEIVEGRSSGIYFENYLSQTIYLEERSNLYFEQVKDYYTLKLKYDSLIEAKALEFRLTAVEKQISIISANFDTYRINNPYNTIRRVQSIEETTNPNYFYLKLSFVPSSRLIVDPNLLKKLTKEEKAFLLLSIDYQSMNFQNHCIDKTINNMEKKFNTFIPIHNNMPLLNSDFMPISHDENFLSNEFIDGRFFSSDETLIITKTQLDELQNIQKGDYIRFTLDESSSINEAIGSGKDTQLMHAINIKRVM
jgi:hypothetical protein